MSRILRLARPLFDLFWRIAGWRHPKMTGAQTKIVQTLLAWEDVTQQPHRFGGVEFRLGSREIGHIHGDWLVDIPFPTKVRDEVVAAGLADPHHILPNSGWISRYLHQPEDVETAIDLLRRSYEIALVQRSKRSTLNPPTDSQKELP